MDGSDAVKLAPRITAVRLYAVRMGGDGGCSETEKAQVTRWLPMVPEERAVRIMRYRRWEDRWRSLAGDMLVRRVLRESYGLTHEQTAFTSGAHGKPQLKLAGPLGIHYNVSHAGAWAVAAFHAKPLGIDIERIGKADMDMAQAMFARREYEALHACSPSDRDRLFYAIWAGKESYIKAVGTGLSIPLDSFSVAAAGLRHSMLLPTVAVEAVDASASACSWHVQLVELDPGYALAVCTSAPMRANRVAVLDAFLLA